MKEKKLCLVPCTIRYRKCLWESVNLTDTNSQHREHLTPCFNDSIRVLLRIHHKPVGNADSLIISASLQVSPYQSGTACLPPGLSHIHLLTEPPIFLPLFPPEQPAEGACRLITKRTTTLIKLAGITKSRNNTPQKAHRLNRQVLFKCFDLWNNRSLVLHCHFIRCQLIKSGSFFSPREQIQGVFLFSCFSIPSPPSGEADCSHQELAPYWSLCDSVDRKERTTRGRCGKVFLATVSVTAITYCDEGRQEDCKIEGKVEWGRREEGLVRGWLVGALLNFTWSCRYETASLPFHQHLLESL